MSERIVVLDPIPEATAQRLRALLPEGFMLSHGARHGEDHLREIIADADYAISGQVPVSAAVLNAARHLKLLHKWGVGVDNLDLDAARARGIQVARTTGSNAVPVAEFAVGLMLSALRHIPQGHEVMQKGEWNDRVTLAEPRMLSGKTVGIVGLGATGKATARLLAGFGCRILYHKPNRLTPAEEAALGVEHADLPRLLAESDVVSLHCPLTPQTAGLVDLEALRSMKRTAVLVNVARGGVVVEADLVRALRERTILAAATDVYEIEPLPADSVLRGVPNLVLTPHLAAMAADNFAPTVQRMFANIVRVSRGEPIPELDRVC
ncbi:MAG: 3-phosphoglycerate dehydrogenase [Ectothiorhodospiraceae bacterium]|nr:3-phosphoglycerate dehydrogenase [Ectothiorhodospiraceae bacterium]